MAKGEAIPIGLSHIVLHTPDPNERDRMNCSDLFSKRGLVNVGGLALITVGILILFIGYPIL